MQKSRGRAALRLAAVLGASPCLLGARGCIEELPVGIIQGQGVSDGGPDDAGPPDAGIPCTKPRPEPRHCHDHAPIAPECIEVRAGKWEWQTDECPSTSDAGSEPCQPTDCYPVIIWTTPQLATGLAPATCADGSMPECERDPSGVCVPGPCPGACGTPDGDSCASDEFCASPIGKCDAKLNGGYCQTRPRSCSDHDEFDPVCGCDGVTYPNFCVAFERGMSIAYQGVCEGPPPLCRDHCATPAPDVPTLPCDDGVHESGPVCVQTPEGCGWQTLTCPAAGMCSLGDTRPRPPDGGCWNDQDCAQGQTCVEQNVCSCGTFCFFADRTDQPGRCE